VGARCKSPVRLPPEPRFAVEQGRAVYKRGQHLHHWESETFIYLTQPTNRARRIAVAIRPRDRCSTAAGSPPSKRMWRRRGKVQGRQTIAATGLPQIDAAGCCVITVLLDISHAPTMPKLRPCPEWAKSVLPLCDQIVMGKFAVPRRWGTNKKHSDLFCRVESLPRKCFSKWLRDEIPWKGVGEYTTTCANCRLRAQLAGIGTRIFVATCMGQERSLSSRQSRGTGSPRDAANRGRSMNEGLSRAIDCMLPGIRLDVCGRVSESRFPATRPRRETRSLAHVSASAIA